MPRIARRKSKTGIYHLILRGINRQVIFEDAEDSAQFLNTLGKYQKEGKFSLYAYCLMGNHVHLLMKENEDLGISMRRIGASYVHWYNWKYERCGHLFQDRYKSETVEDDQYFLTVLRYIHQNPMKAGIVEDLAKYSWSSYQEFIGKPELIDRDYVLGCFDSDIEKALEHFRAFHAIEEHQCCLDVDEKKKWKDEEAIALIKTHCQVNHCRELQDVERGKQKTYIKRLYKEGLSVRQISRITSLGRWVVQERMK